MISFPRLARLLEGNIRPVACSRAVKLQDKTEIWVLFMHKAGFAQNLTNLTLYRFCVWRLFVTVPIDRPLC